MSIAITSHADPATANRSLDHAVIPAHEISLLSLRLTAGALPELSTSSNVCDRLPAVGALWIRGSYLLCAHPHLDVRVRARRPRHEMAGVFS